MNKDEITQYLIEKYKTLEPTLLDIPYGDIALSTLFVLVMIAISKFTNKTITKYYKNPKENKKLNYYFLKSIKGPIKITLISVTILGGLNIAFPGSDSDILIFINKILKVSFIVMIFVYIWNIITNLTEYHKEKAKRTESPLDDQLVPFIGKTFRIFLIVVGVLVVAQNLGYSVSGFIASLGIGGIAVAMASKDTISNIFGSIMLLIDRPFLVGHWIKTDNLEGVVEEIGLRSTKIRTFSKTLINVPNNILANTVIDNQDARTKRRIKMRIGIEYSTSAEMMEKVKGRIESMLSKHKGVNQEYTLVKFDEFNESDLSIFIYYFSKSIKWEEYLDVRQSVNLEIMKILQELNVSFAFPTRTLHINKD